MNGRPPVQGGDGTALDPDYQHRNAINSYPLMIYNRKLDGRDDLKNQQITPGQLAGPSYRFIGGSGYSTPFVIHSEFIVLGWGRGSKVYYLLSIFRHGDHKREAPEGKGPP